MTRISVMLLAAAFGICYSVYGPVCVGRVVSDLRDAPRDFTPVEALMGGNTEESPKVSAAASRRPAVGNRTIYGTDDRREYYELPVDIRLLADSVVSLWRPYRLVPDGIGRYILKTDTLGKSRNLCPGERFREQPVGSFCSGVLVGNDLVLTAGHCVLDMEDCAGTMVVFGFRAEGPGDPGRGNIPSGEVYRCVGIVKRSLTGEADAPIPPPGQIYGPDYALIRLDRRVAGHLPLKVNRSGKILDGASVFAIGHPSGLPQKTAFAGRVRDSSPAAYFLADLDTFGGNSGSPVFNRYTQMIEGILVRGDSDYETTPAGCDRAVVYPQSEGGGEGVTRVSEVSGDIPEPSLSWYR